MWNRKKVSIVFSTHNEKDSIRKEITACLDACFVDEVMVVNNNAAKGTEEEVSKTKAKHVFETKQGFGRGCSRTLKEATGSNNLSPEIVIQLALKRIPFVEIPAQYYERVRESKGSGTFLKSCQLWLEKILAVIRCRLKHTTPCVYK